MAASATRNTLLELLGVDPAGAVGVEFEASAPAAHSEGLQRIDCAVPVQVGTWAIVWDQ